MTPQYRSAQAAIGMAPLAGRLGSLAGGALRLLGADALVDSAESLLGIGSENADPVIADLNEYSPQQWEDWSVATSAPDLTVIATEPQGAVRDFDDNIRERLIQMSASTGGILGVRGCAELITHIVFLCSYPPDEVLEVADRLSREITSARRGEINPE